MKLLERLLVPVDFGNATTDVLKVAGSLARKFGSRVVLYHALPRGEMNELAADMVRDTVRAQLRALVEELRGRGVEYVDVDLQAQAPFAGILEKAREFDANVVIIGSGNQLDDARFPLGTTAEKVIRKSSKPVWTVRPGASGAIRRILCPVDFSTASERALRNAIHLARQFEARLIVLYVEESGTPFLQRLLTARGKKMQEQAREQRMNRFRDLVGSADFFGVDWLRDVRQGQAGTSILDAIKEHEADLVIMGAVGEGAHPRSMLGSTAEKVARQVPTSLVTLKDEDPFRLKLDPALNDLEGRLHQARELLERGFPTEARSAFESCIELDPMFPPAWDGLAAANARLGDEERARDCANAAREIRDRLWKMAVEAEVRNRES